MSTPLTPGAAKKSLGQHFLFDPSVLKRVAAAGGSVEGKTVIEVGPGPGGLTRALLESGAAQMRSATSFWNISTIVPRQPCVLSHSTSIGVPTL